jgi:hypothetical protein
VLELLLEPVVAVAPLLDQRRLVAEPEQRAQDVRADLPPTRDQRVHQAGATSFGACASTAAVSDSIAV